MPRGRSGRRADYDWQAIADAIVAIDAGTGTKAVLGNALVVSQALTLMRLRGQVMVQLDPTAVDERLIIAVGIIKVSDEAFAAGAGSVPGPHSQGDAEWIWHSYLTVTSLAEGAIATNALFDRVVIDSKAMRKCKASETIILVAEVADGVDQGGTWDMLYGFRALTAA